MHRSDELSPFSFTKKPRSSACVGFADEGTRDSHLIITVVLVRFKAPGLLSRATMPKYIASQRCLAGNGAGNGDGTEPLATDPF